MKKTAKEVNVSQVKVADGFWSGMQEKVIDVVIPFQEKVLNDEVPGVAKSHAIENFRIAAGLSQGEFYGMVFQDSDLAKWLEGVAYSLSVKPDPALEKRTDDIIDIIEKAQQPDGYLNTYFTIKEPEHRWQNLHECHELYCAGHMMEAAVAYFDVTGKDKLLHVMERMADHIIDRFGAEEGKEHGIPGHQEVEIGLMKLYRATGKEKYRDMAKYFLEERGKNPDYFHQEKLKRGWQHWGQYSIEAMDVTYNQAHEPIYDQKEAVGHAVRALYMYTAMADVAGADGDERMYQACRTLWDNVVNKKMYITGALGGNPEGEAFSNNYELPNDMAYAETCASIAMVFFAHRMLEMEMDGAYADIMEKELYNSTISGMQLDGKKYFYVNPLECEPGVSGKLFGYQHSLPV
ncbi:MAG: glycoside hydrolase family 127 protein, partial [Lachnospiraceae bacterium]|nr:glycoside hydrolase family 127 protein [Lachnospiraceae bacterium]